jgi:hypothetical protein
MMRALPNRARECIIDTTARAVVKQDWGAIPSMHSRNPGRLFAISAAKSLRVQDVDQKIVALLLIHQFNRGKLKHVSALQVIRLNTRLLTLEFRPLSLTPSLV